MRGYLNIKNLLIAGNVTALTSGWLDYTVMDKSQRVYVLVVSFVFIMQMLKEADKRYYRFRKGRA